MHAEDNKKTMSKISTNQSREVNVDFKFL